jgi:hypothetical protein
MSIASEYKKDQSKRSSLEHRHDYGEQVGPGYYKIQGDIADKLRPSAQTTMTNSLKELSTLSLSKPSDQSSVFLSQTKRPIFLDKKKYSLKSNKLSKYYDEISKNSRNDVDTIE